MEQHGQQTPLLNWAARGLQCLDWVQGSLCCESVLQCGWSLLTGSALALCC